MNREIQYSLLWNKKETNIDIGIHNIIITGARVAQLVSARPSVREVPSSIPGDITSLFQLLSFLCSFD